MAGEVDPHPDDRAVLGRPVVGAGAQVVVAVGEALVHAPDVALVDRHPDLAPDVRGDPAAVIEEGGLLESGPLARAQAGEAGAVGLVAVDVAAAPAAGPDVVVAIGGDAVEARRGRLGRLEQRTHLGGGHGVEVGHQAAIVHRPEDALGVHHAAVDAVAGGDGVGPGQRPGLAVDLVEAVGVGAARLVVPGADPGIGGADVDARAEAD